MALLFLCLLSLSVAVVAEGESSLVVSEISLLYPWVSGSSLEIPFEIFLVCFSYIWLRFLGFFACFYYYSLCLSFALSMLFVLMGLFEVWDEYSASLVFGFCSKGVSDYYYHLFRDFAFLGDSPFCHVNVIGGPWLVLKLMRKYGFWFPLLLWYEDSDFDTSYSGGTRIFSLRGKRFLF